MKTERELVDDFAEKMADKIELRHNRYKPFGWQSMDRKRMLILLKEELVELEQSVSEKEMSDACIDIANYACFIWSMLSTYGRQNPPR